MPPVSRVGDIALGHGSFPPTPAIVGSPDTFVNGIKVHRVGDAIQAHPSPSPSPPHPRAAAAGSPDTFVNSKAVVRIGDAVNCGGMLAEGSPDTIIN